MIAAMGQASTRAAGSVGEVETRYLDLASRSRSTADGRAAAIRVAYETYGTLSPARDNVILVCHALSGDAHAAGVSTTPPARAPATGSRAEDRDGAAGGAGLVGRDDRPRQGVRHRPLLRRLHQPARRLPRHHRPVVDRPGDRPAVRLGLPGRSPSPTWCATERAFLDVLGIERLAAVAGGSLGGMQALEWAVLYPGPGRRRRRDRQHARAAPAGHGLERDRPRGDHARPGLAGRPLLRHRPRARRRHGRGAHGRPRHLPVRRRRWTTSSAGGCSTPTTSATRSPSPSSRSRATCATRPSRSSSASTPTPTSTPRAR